MSDEARPGAGHPPARARRAARPAYPLVAAALGVVVLAASTAQPDVRFSGLRWVPDLAAPTFAPRPRASLSASGPAAPTPLPHPGAHAGPDLTWLLWVAVVVVAAMIAVLVWRRLRAMTPRGAAILSRDALVAAAEPTPVPEEEPQPDAPVIARGFERAIDMLDAAREPRDAVVAAWLGLQDAAAESGITRRLAETPTEFTVRVLRRVPSDQAALDTLLRLYLGVRFGAHRVGEREIADARHALAELAGSWDAPASRPAARPGPGR